MSTNAEEAPEVIVIETTAAPAAEERRNPKPEDNPLHLKGVCVKGMGLHEVSNVQIVRPPFLPRIHTTALGAKTHMNSAGEVKYKMQD